MWTEALTWVKCTNPAGNHKSTWGLRPHKVTSMREESPKSESAGRLGVLGQKIESSYFFQHFLFLYSRLLCASLILVWLLEVGLHLLGLCWTTFRSKYVWRLLGWVKVQWLGDMTLGLCPGTSLSPWWWKISIPGHTLISCDMCSGRDTAGASQVALVVKN